ncbi:MAG: glycosyltransferase family 4 protein [Betaproteobacteria bacterium]
MKLLLVSQYFWPESFGINALASALHDRGVEVTVLTGQPNYPEGAVFPGYSAWRVRREDFQGVEVVRLPLIPRGVRSSLRLTLNYMSFVITGCVLGPWLLRRRHFDAVFVYAPSPLLQALPAVGLARLKRAPLVVWVQDLWPESLSATGFVKNTMVLDLVRGLVRFIYRCSDAILVPSEAFRAPIEALTDNPAKIRYYPNAYVESPLAVANSVDVASLCVNLSSGFSVVFAGNLGVAQSLETIIGAAEILQDKAVNVRFFLIGSGSQSDWLVEEIERRGLANVILPGRFPLAAMAAIYEAASALLVSLRDEPIFALTIPSKVQGYLAAGKPIIASLNGEGARIVLEAGAGLVCRAGDAEGLANAALMLSRVDADKRGKMGENGRRYAIEKFSLDRLADGLVAQLNAMSSAPGEKIQ